MKAHKMVTICIILFLSLPTYSQQLTDNKLITLPKGKKMEFVLIQAGKFVMGSYTDELERHGDEDPVREVTLSRAFYLGKYEVTQGQWLALMDENPSIFTDKADWQDHPVDNVSWNDSQRLIQRLNELGKGTFRLPTEGEWEYACRAGTATRYYWGEDPNNKELQDNAWGFSRAEGRSHPVGLKKPNQWGLFDMSGNVWEWCADWRKAYVASDTLDPEGPTTGIRKIYRGGSWFNEPAALRCANRHGHPPDTKGSNSGLRLVLEVQE